MKKHKSPDVTKFASSVLNVALAMSLEWGENWLAPIQPRIRKAYPELEDEAADNLNLWCIEVRNYAFALVGKDYPLVMENKKATAMEQVKQKYPQIDNENLSR